MSEAVKLTERDFVVMAARYEKMRKALSRVANAWHNCDGDLDDVLERALIAAGFAKKTKLRLGHRIELRLPAALPKGYGK